MVVFYSREGQLANRLWQAANFISNSIEYDYKFLHLGFQEYSAYFIQDNSSGTQYRGCRIPGISPFTFSEKIILKYVSLFFKVKERYKVHLPFICEINFNSYASRYDLSNRSFIRLTKKIVLINGWFFDDGVSVIKHAEIIRRLFTPANIYLENIKRLKDECLSKYDLIIGVHMRRGDYKIYKGGRWYYSNAEYCSFIKQIGLLPTFIGKNFAFLLCSDEEINANDFAGLNIVLATKHLIEDLYALATCDFIIGPPSTFSSWASFYGKVPLLRLTDKDFVIREEQFKVVEQC